MSFTLNKTNTTLSGMIGSTPYNIPFEEKVYEKLKSLDDAIYDAPNATILDALIKQAKAVIEDSQEAMRPKNSFISEKILAKNGKYYLLGKNGVASLAAIPQSLVDKMVSARHEGLPVDPYINAWTLFLRNPNFSLQKAEYFASYLTAKYLDDNQYQELISKGYSESKAKEYATYDEVSITKSGLISTYKYVAYQGNNFEKVEQRFNALPNVHAEDCVFYPPVMRTGGDPVLVDGHLQHNIVVGRLHSLASWDQVNCDDNRSCVKGLHIGSQTYIKCFGGQTRFLLNCLVSPSDIGAFVQDRGSADEGALRVIRYYPVSVNTAPNKGRYHESTLLSKLDEEWEVERERAIADANARIQALENVKLQLNSF